MADPISIAGLAFGIYTTLESLIKAFSFAHGKVSSARKTLREGHMHGNAAAALLKSWLVYWDIEGEDLEKRLDVYWGFEGRTAIIDILHSINEVVASLREMETSYSEIISPRPKSPSGQPSPPPTIVGGKSPISAWFKETGMGIKYVLRDGSKFKQLYEELKQKVSILDDTSLRLFQQRHPGCVQPEQVDIEEPNLVAATIRQASRVLLDELKRSETVISSKFELALIRERFDCTEFRDLLLPTAALRPDTVKFPLALQIDAVGPEEDSVGVLLLVEGMQKTENEDGLASWILQEFQIARGPMIPPMPNPQTKRQTERFHRLASDSPALSYGQMTKMSLRQMIETVKRDNSRFLSLQERFELAYMLSLSVFQLHGSWTYDMDSSSILIDSSSSLNHFLALGKKGKTAEKEIPFDVFRPTQKEIFKLGVVLWEIGLGLTVEQRLEAARGFPFEWVPSLLNPLQKEALAELLIVELRDGMGERYGEIVRNCLRVDFGGPGTSQADFLDLFYHDVVQP